MPARRRREWEDFFISEQTPSESGDTTILSKDGAPDSKGKTLVRIIIGLDVKATLPTGAGGDHMVLSMGIGLASEGILSQISVGTEGDVPISGWMWRWRGVVSEIGITPVRVDLDIRSQRKLMYGQPVLWIFNGQYQGTVFDVDTFGLVRCLYLLE